jgi:dTDP-glucose 4,6-dehydratase
MKRIIVTGGAGFLGSHLCEALLLRGDAVVCVDNLSTSEFINISHLLINKNFTFINTDISNGLQVSGEIDVIANLASPASPPEYLRLPLETLAVGSRGTEHCLKLAKEKHARFVLASTSEIYGDPLVHPQHESYWGNVSSIGPRSVYDEAKRFAEAISVAYKKYEDVDVGIVRIFNTYGPRLRSGDGRVVSNFIVQALAGINLTVYGDGTQTRSFCYVDDLVRGLVKMIDASNFLGPVNLGNPNEITINELAMRILDITKSSSHIDFHDAVEQDPTRRKPAIELAKSFLDWEPAITLESGLLETINWFESSLN